jgi:hypothetical protein
VLTLVVIGTVPSVKVPTLEELKTEELAYVAVVIVDDQIGVVEPLKLAGREAVFHPKVSVQLRPGGVPPPAVRLVVVLAPLAGYMRLLSATA